MNDLFKLALGAITFSPAVLWAQTDPGTVLQIDTQDLVWYVYDATSFSDFAKAPTLTPATPGNRNFRTWTAITDIVAVNGKPAKGVFTNRSIVISLTPTPANGQAIADVERFVQLQIVAEILQMDGTPVGSLMMLGYFGDRLRPARRPARPVTAALISRWLEAPGHLWESAAKLASSSLRRRSVVARQLPKTLVSGANSVEARR